ncbi:MAG TPA: hypothetical protein VHU83_25550 [Bryobacteraceae bacterium]|jgi:hypothetical protein|nr:hypothetical protein [Bryobacteraceae bacterium]
MGRDSRSGVLGAVLIGVGCGLAAAGVALLIPVVTDWWMSSAEKAIQKGRKHVENAATVLGEVAGKAQQRFGDAAKTARETTSKAAGVVETAARHVKEYTA